ncbi:flagellin [Lichenicoccus sp.]|uniref:flagellin N-terminal helical domain-containing protein n=1 Tax=Lichenicoccus sp. TaxID=2781899 RepID=UPI003D0ED0A0
MSGAIGNGFGMMPTLMRTIDKLSAQNVSLTAQLSSGIAADSYAGFGADSSAAISLQPQLDTIDAWQTNISASQTNLSVAQNALSSISSMATSLQSALTGLQSVTSPAAVAALSSTATADLSELTSLLNTQSNGGYVFAGSASDQAPVTGTDLNLSSLVTGIAGAVAQVGTSGASAVESATLAAAAGNDAASPFSAPLSVSPSAAAALVPEVSVGSGLSVPAGMVATQGADIAPADTAATSTGSSIRDLIRVLATVKGLAGADSSTAQFSTLLADTSNLMPAINTALANQSGSLGAQQATLTAQSSSLSDMSDALNTQLNTVMDADPTTVRTQQVALQNQLTASYNLVADEKTLSLVDYI